MVAIAAVCKSDTNNMREDHHLLMTTSYKRI